LEACGHSTPLKIRAFLSRMAGFAIQTLYKRRIPCQTPSYLVRLARRHPVL